MHILLVGSGAREHSLARKIAASRYCTRLWCAPGNPGIAEVAVCADTSWAQRPYDFMQIARGCGLVVIGPERPLAHGLADTLRAAGFPVFGPSKSAARLEGSKIFAKEFMSRHGIPTAPYQTFTDAKAVLQYLHTVDLPKVLKVDGLADGKGAHVLFERHEIEEAVAKMRPRKESPVLVEEFMPGDEISITALTDGKRLIHFPCSRDHKRALDGDHGPNTGGMGAHSPSYWASNRMVEHIRRTILEPTLAGLIADGIDFRGVLYLNIMLTKDGPMVIEYNVRFGDPECQVLMARLESDIVPLLYDCAVGNAAGHHVSFSSDVALSIVLASPGYPDDPQPRGEIRNLAAAAAIPGVSIVHAGTKVSAGRLMPQGGRVLNVCVRAPTMHVARERAYQAVGLIDWPEAQYRTDIGAKFG